MSDVSGLAEKVTLLVDTEFSKLKAALLKKGLLAEEISLSHKGVALDTGYRTNNWKPILEKLLSTQLQQAPDSFKFFIPMPPRNDTVSALEGLGENWGYEILPELITKIREETTRINAMEAPLGSFTPENLRKLATVFEKQRANSAHENRLFYFADFKLGDESKYKIEAFGRLAVKAEEPQEQIEKSSPQLFVFSENCPDSGTKSRLIENLNLFADSLEKTEGEFISKELIENAAVFQVLINAVDLNLKLSDILTGDSVFFRKLTEVNKNSAEFKPNFSSNQTSWEGALYIKPKTLFLVDKTIGEKKFKEILKKSSDDRTGQVPVTLASKKAIIYWELNKDGLSLVPYPDKETLRQEYKEFGPELNTLDKFLIPNLFSKQNPWVHLESTDALSKGGLLYYIYQWNRVTFPILKAIGNDKNYGLSLNVIESLLLLPDFVERMSLPEFREALLKKIFEPAKPDLSVSTATAPGKAIIAQDGYKKATTFMQEAKDICLEILSLEIQIKGKASYNSLTYLTETFPTDLKIKERMGLKVTMQIAANKKTSLAMGLIHISPKAGAGKSFYISLARNNIGNVLNSGGIFKCNEEISLPAQKCMDAALRALKTARDKRIEVKQAAEEMLKEHFPVEMFEMGLSGLSR